MSFEHAHVSKGLMIAFALTSLLTGVFDVKHYLHLQLVPHISRHHQYWRLLVHHLAFSNSSDLLLAELLLYNLGIQIERQFGSVKFASFAIISILISTIFEFLALLLFHRIGLNHIASGPLTLIFSILYQYFRIVPSAYHFRIFGIPLSSKIFSYILASQLAIGHLPGSSSAALIGIIAGQLYRSDLTNLKTWRLSPSTINFASRFVLPVIGSTRPQRRLTRARPDNTRHTARFNAHNLGTEEVITTARTASTFDARTRGNNAGTPGRSGRSMIRQWVNELTGRTANPATGMRVPSDEEIAQLASVYPDVDREVIIAALQRSPNIERAVEMLLSASE